VRILRENIDYQRTGAGLAVEGDLSSLDAARLAASGADTIVIDRLDLLRVEPLDVSVLGFIDAVTKSRKTA
jgi:hypothetical protein